MNDIFSGLWDFLTVPSRLWAMHRSLKRLRLASHGSEQDRQHRSERLKRLELRKAMMQTSSCLTSAGDGDLPDSNSRRRSSSTTAGDQLPPSRSSSSSSPQSYQGLFSPLFYAWTINAGVIFICSLLSNLFTFWSFTEQPTFNFIFKLSSLLVHILIALFMELVNTIFLKKICDRIALLPANASNKSKTSTTKRSGCGRAQSSGSDKQQSQPSTSISLLGKRISNRLYLLLFFIFYQLQWSLVSTLLVWTGLPVAGALVDLFSVSFLYACYSIEYWWRQFANSTFEAFIAYSVEQWTYFVGYGLCLGLLSLWLPHFIGLGGVLLALTYPILVIGALSTGRKQPAGAGGQAPCLASRLCQLALTLSMRPALRLTNTVFLTLQLAYRIWFSR